VAEGTPREAAEGALFKKQIRRGTLQAEKLLGAGQFGEVYLATQILNAETNESIKRAVKKLKGEAHAKAKAEFMSECNVMLEIGEHPNVVQMVGVAIQQTPWLCVLEFEPFGDLRQVVMLCKEKGIVITTEEAVTMMMQCAAGCGHICSKKMVHMDIAARNVLVAANNVCKIADFGLTHKMDKGTDAFMMKKRIPLAMKWLAPEALELQRFSEASDCWSIGVVCWEILAYGVFPLLQIKNAQVLRFLKSGQTLEQTANCDSQLWGIILKCFDLNHEARPKFTKLAKAFGKYLSTIPSKAGIRDLGALISA